MARVLTVIVGLALLALLLFLCLRTHPDDIQADLGKRTGVELARNGLSRASARVDGRDVTLTGVADSAEARSAAGGLIGAVRGVRVVDNQLTVAVTPPPEAGPEPAAVLPGFDLRATRSGNALTLSGLVADDEQRVAIGKLASAGTPGVSVHNELQTGSASPPDWRELTALGIAQLMKLSEGELRINADRWSLSGLAVDAESRAAIETAVGAGVPASLLTRLQIEAPAPANEIDQCQGELDALLATSSIVFEVGSANINSASEALLGQIGQVAGRCIALIRIEGHTDGQGSAAGNLSLSQRRADAVRVHLLALGVDQARVIAQGFGESRPVADNATAEGRARNRRIEFRVEKITP